MNGVSNVNGEGWVVGMLRARVEGWVGQGARVAMSSLRARAQDLRNSIVNVVQHSVMISCARSRAASSKGLLMPAPMFTAWDCNGAGEGGKGLGRSVCAWDGGMVRV